MLFGFNEKKFTRFLNAIILVCFDVYLETISNSHLKLDQHLLI